MTREAEARAIIARVESQSPDAVALATLVSPAVVIEPELLRRVRLAAAPQLDVGAEADLWFTGSSAPAMRRDRTGPGRRGGVT